MNVYELGIDNIMTSLLTGRGLSKQFGGIRALDGFDIELNEGTIVGLIGPNGAGKTTFFNVVTNVHRPDEGTIHFDGEDVTGLPPHKICRRGIARTFQSPKPFHGLNIEENLRVAEYYAHKRTDAKDGRFSLLQQAVDAIRRGRAEDRREYEIISTLGLDDKLDMSIEDLQLMSRKYLELAKAIVTRPRVLLLDEIMAGLNPAEKDEMIATIREIKSEYNLTVVVIEHDLSVIRKICERVIVMNNGTNLAEGPPEDVLGEERVRRAYVGDF